MQAPRSRWRRALLQRAESGATAARSRTPFHRMRRRASVSRLRESTRCGAFTDWTAGDAVLLRRAQRFRHADKRRVTATCPHPHKKQGRPEVGLYAMLRLWLERSDVRADRDRVVFGELLDRHLHERGVGAGAGS